MSEPACLIPSGIFVTALRIRDLGRLRHLCDVRAAVGFRVRVALDGAAYGAVPHFMASAGGKIGTGAAAPWRLKLHN